MAKKAVNKIRFIFRRTRSNLLTLPVLFSTMEKEGFVERAAALTHEHGLRPLLDFILGFPDETEEERLQTLTWIKTLYIKYRARIQIHYFLQLPGPPSEISNPQSSGKQSMARLEQYYRDGICTHDWKQGMELSSKILETKNRIQDKA